MNLKERLYFILNKRKRRESTIREEGFRIFENRMELLKKAVINDISDILKVDEEKIDFSIHEKEGELIIIIKVKE